MNPQFMAGDPWKTGYYCGGALSLALTFSWLCLEVGSRTSEAAILPKFDVPRLLRHLPLRTIDEALGCEAVRACRDYLAHGAYDDFWRDLNWRTRRPQCNVPMLLTGGWYDYYAGETFANHAALLAGQPPKLARRHRVLIGPWTHGVNPSMKLGEVDFGPDSLRDNDSHLIVMPLGWPSRYFS